MLFIPAVRVLLLDRFAARTRGVSYRSRVLQKPLAQLAQHCQSTKGLYCQTKAKNKKRSSKDVFESKTENTYLEFQS